MKFDDIAIGTDIEEIKRFEKKDETFLKRVFSEREILYCKSQSYDAQHFAARYCAKEAVIKALSNFREKGFELNKIEVYHDSNKVPQIRFLNDLAKKYSVKVSLSHDKTKALAYVIIKKNKVKG